MDEQMDNTPAEDDVEGHRIAGKVRHVESDGDDVEGHRIAGKVRHVEGDDDDVEGHRAKKA